MLTFRELGVCGGKGVCGEADLCHSLSRYGTGVHILEPFGFNTPPYIIGEKIHINKSIVRFFGGDNGEEVCNYLNKRGEYFIC